MDNGVLSSNNFLGSGDGAPESAHLAVSAAANTPCDGSGFFMPTSVDLKRSKSTSPPDPPQPEAPATSGNLEWPRSSHSLLPGQPTMLNFSSPNPFPTKNRDGYGSEGSTSEMHSPFTSGWPFTQSQWMELELQALIYKYIVANVPVPSPLLIQIKKSLSPSAFAGSSSVSYAPNSIGWSIFHPGMSGSTDPEHGRCRRTDGKKWRCSREAVPDQRYCERHINRNRNRSRKPVEGQNGQVIVGFTDSKVVPVDSSHSALLMPSRVASKSLVESRHQFKSLQPTTANPSTNAFGNRMQGTQGLSMISPNMDLKCKDTPFSIQNQYVPIRGSSQPEFGLVPSVPHLYSSEERSYISRQSPNSFLIFNDQEAHHQQPLCHFMDNWHKNQSDHCTVGWPEELKSEWNQLSMSNPVTSSCFSSCSNSPRKEKLNLRPLSLPSELDPINTSLGVHKDPTEERSKWNSVTGGNSIGGPLGEALYSISSSVEAIKSSSTLNLVSEVWNGCRQLRSSPTGVLQKATFVSGSNSSSGSSPSAGNKTGGGLPDDVPCSTLASSVCIPSLEMHDLSTKGNVNGKRLEEV